MSQIPVALVTGANRGIGFEVCRQLAEKGYRVLLGARDPEKGKAAAETLRLEGLDIVFQPLDVADEESIEQLAATVTQEYGYLTVLVNNAAIHFDLWQHAASPDFKVVQEAFETNLFGVWRMCVAFLPLLAKAEKARLVNVSSEAGSFMSGEYGLVATGGTLPAYGVTKAALNALTVKLAADAKDSGVLVNAVCPGYTATHPEAVGGRPVSEGAASVVWAATLPVGDTTTGGFFRDGEPLPW